MLLVRKRDGSEERFSEEKLVNSVRRCIERVGLSPEMSLPLVKSAVETLRDRGVGDVVESEVLADAIEATMMAWSVFDPRWLEAAKSYHLYRLYKEVGRDPEDVHPRDRLLSYQALRLLRSRYLLRDPATGRVVETPQEMFARVARTVAQAERLYGSSEEEVRRIAQEFYELMSDLRFLPNSPTLMNAGTKLNQLAACFVVPVEDSIEGIFDALAVMAKLQKTGAGVGFDFSSLRPKGDPISSTGGASSGPVSFMKIFDVTAEVMKEGGRRRGAMMAIMHDWHPDVLEFIEAKCVDPDAFPNFNLSVAVHDEFMRRAVSGGEWYLVNPRECPEIMSAVKGEVVEIAKRCKNVRRVRAPEVFERIVMCAWASGDPGLVFIDRVNEHNPTPSLGIIRATNPCGETPLLEWEACNLGSLNLAKYVSRAGGEPVIDWHSLGKDVELAVRFLDDVIDVSDYPDARIAEAVRKTRKVGLGVMGLADMLVELGVRYDSDDAFYLVDHLMEFIAFKAKEASVKLAKERGPYPEFKRSRHANGWFNWEPQVDRQRVYDEGAVSQRVRRMVESRPRLDWERLREEVKRYGLRNASLTTIAPTGSISIIAGVNSGIEPYFALAYVRFTSVGAFIEVNKYLQQWMASRGLLTDENIRWLVSSGSVMGAPWAPKELREVLRTAHDIDPLDHVRMQAVVQRWVDNAVSKTINMKAEASVEDVRKAYILAWELGCKGITVYRDRSKPSQVIAVGEELKKVLRKPPAAPRVRAKNVPLMLRIRKEEVKAVTEEYAGGCPSCDL